MELQPRQPRTKGPAETHTDDVSFDVIAKGEEPPRTRRHKPAQSAPPDGLLDPSVRQLIPSDGCDRRNRVAAASDGPARKRGL